jgi:radical SAM/Cys-rich protein
VTTKLSLLHQRHPLAAAEEQRARLASLPLAETFAQRVASTPMKVLTATGVDVFQINVGRKCNQTCAHCHVDAGPDRKEMMPDDVVDACLRVLERSGAKTFDITGGAPEMHDRFEELVDRGVRMGKHVMDRCNLTILTVPKYAHLPKFFADRKVEVVSSLPYFDEDGTDRQRGDGVFEKSIRAMRALNELGYGVPGSGLTFTLVANPVGAFLPAPQEDLEAQFKRELKAKHGVEFTRLIAITNMPISRYLEWLDRSGNTERYMNKLYAAFNPDAAAGVMCRNTISVGYDGRLFDCDFNQMLEMPLVDGAPRTIFEYDEALLSKRGIAVAAHCFGCTAGQGSSCGGATA